MGGKWHNVSDFDRHLSSYHDLRSLLQRLHVRLLIFWRCNVAVLMHEAKPRALRYAFNILPKRKWSEQLISEIGYRVFGSGLNVPSLRQSPESLPPTRVLGTSISNGNLYSAISQVIQIWVLFDITWLRPPFSRSENASWSCKSVVFLLIYDILVLDFFKHLHKATSEVLP